MISSLFPSRRRKQANRGQRRTRRGERLDLQPLEERIALAIDVFQLPMNAVDSSANNYAVLVLDQGDAGFLKRNAGGAFTYANNSQFLDNGTTQTSMPVAGTTPKFGDLTTFYVTSGQRTMFTGTPLVEPAPGKPALGKVVSFPNTNGDIDVGTAGGIVPGTFSAKLNVTDTSGNTESGLVIASSPGETWNLNFSGDLGSLKPSRGSIDEFTGAIKLEWSTAPFSVKLDPIDWAVYTGPPADVEPLSFTVAPGQNVTQSMIFDLALVPSTVTINSPVLAVDGPGSTAPFFRPAGSISIAADTVVINANASSSSLFSVTSEDVTINRPVAAPTHGLAITGTPAKPGRLLVSEQGAVTRAIADPSGVSADVLSVTAVHADVIIAGVVNATAQTYLLQSPLDPRAYSLTTVSPTSGVQTGRILGDTVGITLANDAGGEVNVRTTIDTLRMTAASTLTEPALPYAIAVTESDDLVVDAVPASRRPIVLDVAGLLTLASSVQTTGSLTLAARNQLKLSGAVSSAAGDIVLVSDSITSNSPITAGGTRSISLQSRDVAGDVVLNGLVRAGGVAKSPARAASTADINLVKGGLLTPIDGVTLVAGDRVLVKNQTNPAENGIYVAGFAAWFRAADANTAQLLLPGFTVAVREGNQQGAWTFANASSPTLGQTGLAFVPASAVQTYGPVRAATTSDFNLSTGGLLIPIDGVTLLPGDRVLVKNQANTRQNGLYIADLGPWVRAADANTVAELVAGSYVFVTDGTTNGQKGFVLADDAVQVGNTPLTFNSFTVQATRTNNYSPAHVLASVVAATTMHIDLAAPPVEIDGIDLVAGDLVLVKNQYDSAANGVYVYAATGLRRSTDADSSSELPRGTVVFVEQGATNAGSSWTFNDTVDLLGQTTTGSLQVTGLASTLYLASGMLVTGPGIPANTTIDLVNNSSSVRLTKSALATSSTAALGFMQTSSVVIDTTPILFVPTGGTAAITAGRSVISSTTSASSRVTASSALVTAGRPVSGTPDAASLIDVNSAVGRLTAIAPASVDVSDAGAIDLFDARALVGGSVTVEAQGTITARSVSAVGSATTPADISLTSLYGDVVAAAVKSSIGSIALTSVNEQVVVRRLGLNAASVVAQDGDVVAVADAGGILLAGPIQAGGADGDITLQSDQAGLALVSPASLLASDRLTVITPNAVPSLATGTAVSAKALTITSRFGVPQAPAAGFGTFPSVTMNRTDAGNINYTSLAALNVEGATTVGGSITFSAPVLQVTGGVTSVGAATDVTLTATTGDLVLDGTVTAQRDVFLNAVGGSIGGVAAGRSTLIVAPGTVTVTAKTAATLRTKAQALRATLTDNNASLDVVDDDGLDVPSAVLAAGGTVTLTVGSTALGGGTSIGLINAGATGVVTISSYGDILQSPVDAAADIVAGSATLTSTAGQIFVDTNVDVLTARTFQKTAPITINDIGTGPALFTLRDVSGVGTGADITITSPRTIVAESVTTAGRVNLSTTAAGAPIQVGTVRATGNTATLNARGSVRKLNAASLITATSVVLDTATGTIDAALDAANVAAGSGSGGRIALTDADALSIGNDVLARGISTAGPVDIQVGGSLTQTQPIVAQSLSAASSGGDISLQNASNNVDVLTVNNGTRIVAFADKNDLRLDSIIGGAISVTAGGPLSQAGAITGTSLAVYSIAGAVSLTNAANDVDTLFISAADHVSFFDQNDLTIASSGVIGSDVSLTAGTTLTIGGPITAGTSASGDGDVTLTAVAGNIVLAAGVSAVNDRVTLEARNGTISQSAGRIDAQTLVWFATTAPNPALNSAHTVIGPNLTAAGDLPIISTTANPLTIAGASTVDGNIIVSAPSVRITDTIKTGTTGNSVSVTATGGNIAFAVPTKRGIVAAGGTIALAASSGQIVSEEKQYPAVAGGALTINAQSADLKTSVTSATATVSSGGLALTAVGGLALGAIQAVGQTVKLDAAEGISQQAGTGIQAASLVATNVSGSVSLTSSTNNVSAISIVNGSGNVSFVDATSFSVVAPGVSAGSIPAGDGDVALTSTAGDIDIAANISAPNDRVTLTARNGAISQQPGTLIDCGTLVWFAQSAPNFDGTYTVVGPNLAGPGSLTIGPFPGTVSIAGASTVNGDITIIGDSVVITDPVVAGGVGRSVTVAATTGGISLQSLGRITTSNGPIILSAVNGGIVAANAATVTSVTGASLAIEALDTSTLKTTVSSLSGAISEGGLMLTETDSLTITGLEVRDTATLGVGGSLLQSGAIKAGILAVTASGPVTLANQANDTGVFSVSAAGRPVAYTDVNELVIGGIMAGAIDLTVGNKLSQTGPIVGTALKITSTTRGVQLPNAANDVDSLFVSNGTRVVNFTDKDDLAVTGMTAGSAILTVGGNLTQTGAITAASLNVAASAGTVSLTRADNDIDWLTGTNPGRGLSLTDRDDLAIGGLTAGAMSLAVGGNLAQANPIVGTSLSVVATAGTVTLTNPGNDVSSLTVSNPSRGVSYTNATGLNVGGLTLGGGNLAVGGDLTQSGPITGTSLGITSSGTVTLTNAANNLNVLSLANGSRLFSYTDSNDIGIYSTGTLSVGTVKVGTLLAVSTTNGGGVDVGPQANGLLQAGSTIDLRNVQGSIGVRNGGRIVAPTILLPPGKGIQVGGAITDPASLNAAITTVNSLPTIPGSTYEIFVTSSMTLTQQLSVNKPVTFRGASQNVVLSGSAAVTSGLLLNSGASGSTVRDIAFRGFSGDAIRVTSATGISIAGIRALNSGNGLSISGGGTGTVVQGSTFDRNLTGIRLTNVTNALVGGTAAGQGNVISNSSREGIYATGFCTNTKLIKNTFPGTTKKYNVSTSRGITVVN